MSERVLSFGRRADQVGVLSVPADSGAPAEPRSSSAMPPTRPAVLFWNVGVNHRVGPFRVFVDLSRRLAEAGFVAFRFDASGFGDSAVRRDAVSDSEREELDIADAMDAVTRRTGVNRFILVGFCSSVDSAHRVAVKDPRVVGTIQIEGYSFRTKGHTLRVPLRLLNPQRWRRLRTLSTRALLGRLIGQHEPVPGGGGAVFQRVYPSWPSYAREIAVLSQRQVEMLFVYVGGDTTFNHIEQFWDMFETPETDRRRIEVTYRPKADHTFYDVEQRHELVEQVIGWLSARHGR